MNQNKLSTSDQTVTLNYTLLYIIYNLICFPHYVIGILSRINIYILNLPFAQFCIICCCIPLYTIIIILLYYITLLYFQIKIY